MNLYERSVCDGLAPDEETPISDSMEWLREHCDRLACELEATSRALVEATDKLRKREVGQ